ncbi:MAG: NAD-binding protein [Candidatus Thermoplasmatota archaeon]|nr:NAD-binding protein [Candidatus Thermoplasmatota archaeon]
MYVIIVGAGGIGRHLTALKLSEAHHNVVVIDKDEERCEYIARKFDAVAINADATHEETLDELDTKKADVLIATTSDDATNLLVVSLAKNRGVKNLIAVVNQEESKPLYLEKGVKIMRKPDIVVAEMIYKAIKHPTIEGYLDVDDYAEVIRLPLQKISSFVGKTIGDVWVHHKSLIVAIERENAFIIPKQDLTLCENDMITILIHKERVDKVVKIFSS